MAWTRVDDSFPDNPKAILAGPLARDLWLTCNCYCNKHLTDGFVPAAMVKKLADTDELDKLGVTVDSLIQRLLTPPPGYEYGLWEPVNGGYLVHDYFEYNRSRAAIEAERADAKERANKSRNKARAEKLIEETRAKYGVSNGERAPERATQQPDENSLSLSLNRGTGMGMGEGARSAHVQRNTPRTSHRTSQESHTARAGATGENAVRARVYEAWFKVAPKTRTPPATLEPAVTTALSEGFDIDLLAEFIGTATRNTDAGPGMVAYFAKMVKEHGEAGIKTLADYQAKEAGRSEGQQQRRTDRRNPAGGYDYANDPLREYAITDDDMPDMPDNDSQPR